MDGLELVLRFAHPANIAGYCGPLQPIIPSYLKNNHSHDRGELIDTVNSFEGLPLFLKAIAKACGKPYLSYQVAEAYCLKNDISNSVTGRAVFNSPEWRAIFNSTLQSLSTRLPDEPLTHNFNVYYIDGLLTRGNLSHIDACRVSVGRVIGYSGSRFAVKTDKLLGDGVGKKSKLEERVVIAVAPFDKLRKHDYVALHHGMVFAVIPEETHDRIVIDNQEKLSGLNYLLKQPAT